MPCWAVVEFLARGEVEAIDLYNYRSMVEAVPACWLFNNNQQCYWPEKSFHPSLLIKKEATPDPSWQTYDVRVFKTYDSLKVAREKCKTSEVTSDLNSELEIEDGHLKRSIIPNSRYLETSSSEDDDGIKPKKKQKTTKRESFDSNSDEDFGVHSLPDIELFGSSSSQITTGYKHKPISKSGEKPPGNLSKSSEPKKHSPKSCNGTPSRILNSTSSPATPGPSTHTPLRPLMPTGLLKTPPTSHLDDQAWKKSVSKSLAVLKVNQSIMKELIESLISRQNKVNENIEDEADLSAIYEQFPLETAEDLSEIEEKLKEKHIFDSMVKNFSIVGGESTKEAVKRLLRRFLTDELAQNYSYLGFKKKRVFADLRLKSVLFDSVRANVSLAKSTDSEIEAVIKDWLRQAKSRAEQKLRNKRDNIPGSGAKQHPTIEDQISNVETPKAKTS